MIDDAVREGIDAARASFEEVLKGDPKLAKSMIQLAWADASTFSDLGDRTFGPRSGVVMRLWTQACYFTSEC